MKKLLWLLIVAGTSRNCYSQESFELRDEVHQYLTQSNSNFHFAMLAEAYRENIRVAFFWPCMIDSVIVDNNIIAVAFEKQNDDWVTIDMFISSNDTAMKKFYQIIGGNDYKVVKPNGVPLENLGNFMHENIRNAHKAIVNKEPEKGIFTIEEFARAFGLRTCVFSKIMADYIMRGAKILEVSEIKITDVVTVNNTGSAKLDVYFPSEARSNKVKLIKIGTGWAIDGM